MSIQIIKISCIEAAVMTIYNDNYSFSSDSLPNKNLKKYIRVWW